MVTPAFRKALLTSAVVLLAMGSARAHDIITTNLTYSRDVSRILQRRCTGCHGASSSIPLTNYGQVRPWAVDIKEQVLNRLMPPWGAVKGFGDLRPDGALNQEEIMTLAGWAIGGAPEGSRQLLPKTIEVVKEPVTPVFADTVRVQTQVTLQEPLRISGVKPTPKGPVNSVQIVAKLPDGKITPLVWLYKYDPKWTHDFRFRAPLELPAGSTVAASAPVDFVLETRVGGEKISKR